MSKFFSIPGVKVHQAEERPRGVRLPPLEANPRLREWLASRKPTSHMKVGIDGKVAFRGDGAVVHGEEHDQHSGSVTQYVQRSDPTGSGTYAVRWEPGDSPRTMVQAEAKRIHE